MTSIQFGTDGWHVIAEDFTDENVRKVTHAIARYIVRAENPGSGVSVGYDTRFASGRFAPRCLVCHRNGHTGIARDRT
jgi:phosphomannomutase